MIVYLDTSGLLKRFVDEPHTEEVRVWARAADAVALSRVTLPEAVAAIARRRRRGDVSLAAAQVLAGDIETFWRVSAVVELDEERAADLAFSSIDAALNRAAVAEGLAVLEPPG